jgi:putative Mn2+ efflux pump MntP
MHARRRWNALGCLPSPRVVAKLIALIVPLGLDTFGVAAGLGRGGVSRFGRRRLTLLFTGFETGMPLIGVLLGAPLATAIGSAAEYVAIAVLLAFGIYTLVSDSDEDGRLAGLARSRDVRVLLLLGLSISLDELAIGFTLGLLKLPVALVLVLIAVQTAVVTQAGLRLGHSLSERTREGAERLAGVALTGLGLVLLAEALAK